MYLRETDVGLLDGQLSSEPKNKMKGRVGVIVGLMLGVVFACAYLQPFSTAKADQLGNAHQKDVNHVVNEVYKESLYAVNKSLEPISMMSTTLPWPYNGKFDPAASGVQMSFMPYEPHQPRADANKWFEKTFWAEEFKKDPLAAHFNENRLKEEPVGTVVSRSLGDMLTGSPLEPSLKATLNTIYFYSHRKTLQSYHLPLKDHDRRLRGATMKVYGCKEKHTVTEAVKWAKERRRPFELAILSGKWPDMQHFHADVKAHPNLYNLLDVRGHFGDFAQAKEYCKQDGSNNMMQITLKPWSHHLLFRPKIMALSAGHKTKTDTLSLINFVAGDDSFKPASKNEGYANGYIGLKRECKVPSQPFSLGFGPNQASQALLQMFVESIDDCGTHKTGIKCPPFQNQQGYPDSVRLHVLLINPAQTTIRR